MLQLEDTQKRELNKTSNQKIAAESLESTISRHGRCSIASAYSGRAGRELSLWEMLPASFGSS
jgi:hypothetical protein